MERTSSSKRRPLGGCRLPIGLPLLALGRLLQGLVFLCQGIAIFVSVIVAERKGIASG